jgi:hypothetical protein
MRDLAEDPAFASTYLTDFVLARLRKGRVRKQETLY